MTHTKSDNAIYAPPVKSNNTLQNKDQINIIEYNNSIHLDLLAIGKTIINYKGKTIAECQNINDQIIIRINSEQPLTIEGGCVRKNIDIISKSTITIADELKESRKININAKDIICTKSINCDDLKLRASNDIELKGDIRAERLKATADNKIINRGTVKTENSLELQAQAIKNFKELSADKELELIAKKIYTAKDTSINSQQLSRIVSEECYFNGNLNLNDTGILIAERIDFQGNVTLPAILHCHTKQMNCFKSAQIYKEDQNGEKTSNVQIDTQLNIIDNAKLDLKTVNLKTKQLYNSGTLHISDSILDIEQLENNSSSQLLITGSDITGKQINNKQNICIKNSSVDLETINSKNGNIEIKDSSYRCKHNHIENNFSLLNSTISAQSWNQNQGILTIKGNNNKQAMIHKYFALNENATLKLAETTLSAPESMRLNGKTTCKNAKLTSKNITCSGNNEIKLSNSELVGHAFLTLDKKCTLKNSTLRSRKLRINKNICSTNSSCIAESVHLEAEEVNGNNFTIEADKELALINTDNKSNKITNTKITTNDLIISNNWRFEDSSVNINDDVNHSTNFTGSIEVVNSDFTTNGQIYTSKESKLKIINTQELATNTKQITSKLLCSLGDTQLNNSKLNFQKYIQHENILKMKNSQINAKDEILINKANVKADSTSEMQSEKISIIGNSKVIIGEKKTDKPNKQEPSASTTTDANTTAANNQKVNLDAKSELYLDKNAILEINQGAAASKLIKIFGKLSMNSSLLSTEDLEIYGQLLTNKSQLAATEDINIHTKATLASTSSSITAKNLTNENELSLKDRSSLTTKETITTTKESHTILNNSNIKTDTFKHNGDLEATCNKGEVLNKKIEANIDVKSMITGTNSKIHGDNLAIEAKSLRHSGDMDFTDTLVIKGNRLHNLLGVIAAEKNLNLGFDHYVFNMGHLTGKNVTINSNFVNLLGIVNAVNYTANGLVNLNLAGLVSAFNLQQNSLLSFNGGLLLPNLPDELGDIFKWQTLSTVSKIALTNLFPEYSSLINLGFLFANPVINHISNHTSEYWRAISSPSEIPNMIQSSFANLTDIDSWKNYIDEKYDDLVNIRFHEIMPMICQVKSGIVNASNAFDTIKSSTGDASKLFDINRSTFKKAFTSDAYKNIGRQTLGALGPSINDETILHCNVGATISQNVTKTSFLYSNYGKETGLNSITVNTKQLNNHGDINSLQTNLNAKNIDNHKNIDGKRALNIKAETLANSKKATITSKKAGFKLDTMNQSGTLILEGGLLDIGQSTLDYGSSNQLENVYINGDNLTQNGDFSFKNGYIKLTEDMQTGINSKTYTENLSLNAKNLQHHGDWQFKGLLSLDLMERLQTGDKSSLIGATSKPEANEKEKNILVAKAKTMDFNGIHSGGDETHLQAEKITHNTSSKTNLNHATIQCTEHNIKGKVALTDSFIDTTQSNSEAEKKQTEENNPSSETKLEGTINLENDGELTLQNSKVHTDHLNQDGQLLATKNAANQEVDILITKDFKQSDTANTTLNNQNIKTSSMNQDGTINATGNNNVIVDEKFTQGKQAHTAVAKSDKSDTKNASENETSKNSLQIHANEHAISGTNDGGDSLIYSGGNAKYDGATLNHVSAAHDNISLKNISATDSTAYAKENINLEKNSTNKIKDTNLVSEKNITNAGHLLAEGHNVIQAKETFTQKSEGAIDVKKSTTQKNDKTATSENSVHVQSKQNNISGKINGGDQMAIVGEHATFNNAEINNVYAKHDDTKLTGNNKLKDTYVKTEKSLELAKGSTNDITNVSLESGNTVKNAGTINAHGHNDIEAKGEFTQTNDGKINVEKSAKKADDKNKETDPQHSLAIKANSHQISGSMNAGDQLVISGGKAKYVNSNLNGVISEHETTQYSGKNSLKECYSVAKKDMTFDKGSNNNVENCGFKAENTLRDDSNMTCTGVNSFAATTYLHNGNIKESKPNPKAPNAVHVKAKKADLKGTSNIATGSYDIENLAAAQDFIAGTNRYANYKFNNLLAVNTHNDLTINTKINRNCSLDLTANSINWQSAYNSKNDLFLTSTQGNINISNSVQTKNIYLESAKNIYSNNNLHATDTVYAKAANDFYNLGGDIYGNTVAITAANIYNITRDSVVATKNYPIKTGDKGAIRSKNETLLEATKGDIANYGGLIHSDNYTQLVAKNNVLNICNEYTYQGRYDTEKRYKDAVISGGKGVDHDNYGVVIQAGNRVINDGSSILSQSNGAIHGDNGVDFLARSHNYVCNYKKQKKSFGRKKVTMDTATTIQGSNVIMNNGHADISSKNGNVKAVATNFLTRDGTDIYAKNDVNLYSLIAQNRHYESKSALWGLVSNKKDELHQEAKPVLIYDNGNTHIHAHNGNINSRGTIFAGNGDLHLKAGKNINLSRDILQHSLHTQTRSLNVSFLGMNAYNSYKHDGNCWQMLASEDPTLGKFNSLLNANTPLEQGAAAFNFGIEAFNTVNNIASGINNGNLGTELLMRYKLGDASGFNPTVKLSLTQTDTSANYQTLGTGSIDRNNVTFDAGNNVNLANGMTVKAHNDCTVKAKELNITSAALHAKSKTNSESVGVGVTVKGNVAEVDVAISENKCENTHHVNSTMDVDGHLHLAVDTLNIAGGNIDAETMSTEIKLAKITTLQDTSSSKSFSASASSTGFVSGFFGQNNTATTGQASGIHVRQSVGNDCHIEKLVNTGGEFTSDGVMAAKIDKCENHSVKDHKNGGGFGVGLNIHDISNAISGDKHKNNSAAPGQKAIPTIGVTAQYTDYKGEQQATIHGDEGTLLATHEITGKLNTTEKHGYKVKRDIAENIKLDIPIINGEKISQATENIRQATVTVVNEIKEVANKCTTPELHELSTEAFITTKLELNNELINQQVEKPEQTNTEDKPINNQDTAEKEPSDSKTEETETKEDKPVELTISSIVLQLPTKEEEMIEQSINNEKPRINKSPRDIKDSGVKIGQKDGPYSSKRFFDLKTGKFINPKDALIDNFKKESGCEFTTDTSLSLELFNSQNEASVLWHSNPWLRSSPLNVQAQVIDSGYNQYCVASFDPAHGQLCVDLGAGRSLRLNIAEGEVNIPLLGKCEYVVDLAEISAAANATVSTENGFDAHADVKAGIYGPSVTASLQEHEICFFGFKIGGSPEVTVGTGLSANLGAGATIDKTKPQIRLYAKAGVRAKVGGEGKLNLTVGIDTEVFDRVNNAIEKNVKSQMEDGIYADLLRKLEADPSPEAEAMRMEILDNIAELAGYSAIPAMFSFK